MDVTGWLGSRQEALGQCVQRTSRGCRYWIITKYQGHFQVLALLHGRDWPLQGCGSHGMHLARLQKVSMKQQMLADLFCL